MRARFFAKASISTEAPDSVSVAGFAVESVNSPPQPSSIAPHVSLVRLRWISADVDASKSVQEARRLYGLFNCGNPKLVVNSVSLDPAVATLPADDKILRLTA
jgi:hypothetical protein